MVYPSLAGVARFSGPGVDLSSWAFHPSPVPLRRGTLNGLSHAGGGGPLQRDGGGHCCLGFSILPLRPSEGGHLRWCVAHYVLDTGPPISRGQAFAGMTILSTAGGGGLLQRAGGGLDVLGFPSSPCAPFEGGHLWWALVLTTLPSKRHFWGRA